MEILDGIDAVVKRVFVKKGEDPYATVEWENRDAVIYTNNNTVVFEQKGIEVPKNWSQTALNIVASKYFHGALNSEKRESSIKKLIERVVTTISEFGRKNGYFLNDDEYTAFIDDLKYILVHQIAAFNSPVWFNVGIEEHPQASACFINSVSDSMESILNLNKIEGMLFKGGSGTGTNLSLLRSSKEKLSSGGYASGPVSFMKGFDAFAGVIKSGGKTRRAAKMIILNIDHPDIVDFIKAKVIEERKAMHLINAGYNSSMDSSNPNSAYYSLFFQNSNNSVRVSDDFMMKVIDDDVWETKYITTGKTADTYKAIDLLKMIAEATWECGDPGIQFDSTINKWNTCKNSGRINASNPCSEFMFLDNTACNLSSINLMKILENNQFNVEMFKHIVDIMITAMEILVDLSSYPTPEITENSILYRPLGIGFANLGAMLMSLGIPYDSEEGRSMAAAISAIMTGEGYITSACWAAKKGAFKEYEKNKEPFLEVIEEHKHEAKKLSRINIPNLKYLFKNAVAVWDKAYNLGKEYGFRNSQISAIAPTGTIGLMMDCDTTGIEPDLSLVKYKWMVDGGVIKFVTKCVSDALSSLKYDSTDIEDIIKYVDENGTIENAPHLKPDDLPVFDCALKPQKGIRVLSPMAHIKMMAAVQPFISGAISKTVNVPEDATLEDIESIYLDAWRLKLKSVAIYRDNSKKIQPLRTDNKAKNIPKRVKLPDERKAITHKFSVGGQEGYITVGLYEDEKPGEIFVVMAKEGSTLSGLVDSFATVFSISLQYGVPLKEIVRKLAYTRYDPSGRTSSNKIPFATSITDYIAKWLAYKFLTKEDIDEIGLGDKNGINITEHDSKSNPHDNIATNIKPIDNFISQKRIEKSSSPICSECGTLMIQTGSCYSCPQCGSTSGCA
ncbi:MAG: vitamin B12-dependent ribonucleotide reductase [Candidatus Thermoplasmatota archaeon]|nr:vitamin B12-dependent ribonucleotide reductase [Candidatus Thermoplasmatota archaeon]MCL5964045.1 vitamin B12-dependent ribonucleotide reductase [Candidatus Thermoplasmatota archaeon]